MDLTATFAPANSCLRFFTCDELRTSLVTPELDVETANDGRAYPKKFVDELLVALRLTVERCGEPKAYHACATAAYSHLLQVSHVISNYCIQNSSMVMRIPSPRYPRRRHADVLCQPQGRARLPYRRAPLLVQLSPNHRRFFAEFWAQRRLKLKSSIPWKASSRVETLTLVGLLAVC